MVTVHLMSDEKFIDVFIERMERNSDRQHRYIVFSNNKKLKHIKSSQCIQVPVNSLRALLEINKIKNLDKIILHAVSVNFKWIVPLLPKNKKIIWIFYGNEYFGLPSVRNFFIQEKTLGYLSTSYNKYWSFLRNIKAKINEKVAILAFRKATHFAHFIYEDYEIIKNTINIKPKFVEFAYSTSRFCGNRVLGVQGEDICLGNSGSPFNNHIDAIDILSKMDIGNRKILCPLSYGANESYIQEVIKKGKRILGNNFKPITDFMDIDKYNDLMASVGFTIMNHKRSQASGNIIARAHDGGKVFLCDNSLYRMLKKAGIQVYSIEKDFTPDNPEVFDPLCTETITRNRKIIEDLFGDAKAIERYRTLDAL